MVMTLMPTALGKTSMNDYKLLQLSQTRNSGRSLKRRKVRR
ncbi:hypothetical protein ID866_13325 [Astraeus odoratus]|nr:hypothetical protein ID866_13325 [Astraeus odoratus]